MDDKRVQKKFIEKEIEFYGTDHIYGIDIFNEMIPPSWEPEYLGRVSRQVYESLEAADPEATWLEMTWLFWNERQYWEIDNRIEAPTACPSRLSSASRLQPTMSSGRRKSSWETFPS